MLILHDQISRYHWVSFHQSDNAVEINGTETNKRVHRRSHLLVLEFDRNRQDRLASHRRYGFLPRFLAFEFG